MYNEIIEKCGADTQTVIDLFKLFEVIPSVHLEKYLSRHFDMNVLEVRKFLARLEANELIFNNFSYGYRSLYRNLKENYDASKMFSVMAQLAKKNCHIAKCDFPFDFILAYEEKEGDKIGKLFQIIDFDNSGVYKLSVFNRQPKCPDSYMNIIPVIVTSDSSLESLKLRDENGDYYLIPECDYFLAIVSYDNNSKEKYSVKTLIKKAGTI